jgi:hypothetical protein
MHAASWMDLPKRQRIGQALAATFSAGMFLYGGLIPCCPGRGRGWVAGSARPRA